MNRDSVRPRAPRFGGQGFGFVRGRPSPLWPALVALACGASEAEPGPRSEPVLATATDLDTAPGVVEIALEAAEGNKRYSGALETPVWMYNGTIPGPLIEASTGDELVVRFTNRLPEGTTIHWHGLRLPAVMDGTLAMQNPIAPGGTFEYRFALKDAGLFWFHPHIRSDVQIEKGLYGVLRVRGADEPVADQERIVVLDDVRVLPDGTLPTYLDDDSRMLGRQGNTLLFNGEPMPELRWQAGSLQRLRLVNVANGRFFNLALPGYTWRVIGTDGGLLPAPYDVEHLLIAPGERYDVMLIVEGEPGAEVTLMNDPYERGHDTGQEPAAPVARFVVDEAPPLAGRLLPSEFPELERLPDGPADHEVVLDEGLEAGNLLFTINGATYPDVPPITLPLAAVRRLVVRNDSPMDHPFHVHGAFFQVLSSDGVSTASAALANKDTIIVPQNAELKLATRFDAPGRWMYHCHVLEHAEGGMMGELQVMEAAP